MVKQNSTSTTAVSGKRHDDNDIDYDCGGKQMDTDQTQEGSSLSQKLKTDNSLQQLAAQHGLITAKGWAELPIRPFVATSPTEGDGDRQAEVQEIVNAVNKFVRLVRGFEGQDMW